MNDLKVCEKHATIKAVENRTKCDYNWRNLRNYCINRELDIEDVLDPTYGTVKSYPAEAWENVYNINLTVLFSKRIK